MQRLGAAPVHDALAVCAIIDPTVITTRFAHVDVETTGELTAGRTVCDFRFSGRTPAEAHMHPHQKPRRPSAFELQERGRRFPPHHLHESWLDYLYWDIELEA